MQTKLNNMAEKESIITIRNVNPKHKELISLIAKNSGQTLSQFLKVDIKKLIDNAPAGLKMKD